MNNKDFIGQVRGQHRVLTSRTAHFSQVCFSLGLNVMTTSKVCWLKVDLSSPPLHLYKQQELHRDVGYILTSSSTRQRNLDLMIFYGTVISGNKGVILTCQWADMRRAIYCVISSAVLEFESKFLFRSRLSFDLT